MKNVEFLGYKPTPNDKFSLGYATIRYPVKVFDLEEKQVVRYKHIRKKDGGDFIADITNQIDGENVKMMFLDSSSMNDMLKDYVREQVKKVISTTSVFEVADAQGLPF